MIALLSAPSNLGLRPPQTGSVPGCAKAPEALREAGLFRSFLDAGSIDAGVVLSGRYAADWVPGEGRVRNQEALVDHARRLADRLGALLDDGGSPLVLGGDCSILLGAGLALARRGRFGLVHVDGHTDFRHPGNSSVCASVGGEDLAAAVGLHWPRLADLDGYGPYFAPSDTVHIGCRDNDEELHEATALLGATMPTSHVRSAGPAAAADRAVAVAGRGSNGYWLHIDVDVLDPAYLPAVDSPDPGGLTPEELTELLQALAPGAVGAEVTIFDPDLDPDGAYARLLAEVLAAGLRDLGAASGN
ncbi:arginase family protein [Arthrobacter sp. zg-Y895]|uniref:arginase family protein n=1 Tax=Arthrobacter sp. zg-Y895 TaxID=2886933 RepID=UPI001D14D6F8|nr:arginase family protein [Arthrobacter sp. zg-Y895]